MAVGSSRPGPLPADTETRIAAFTELVATAIANTEARRELEQVAAEHAALGRVATLVAEAVPPGDVFAAVTAEVARLFGVPLVGLFRYEREGMATVIAGAGNLAPYLGRPWPCPPGDPGLVASVQRTGRPLRIDDYTQVSSAISGPVREAGVGKAAGVPVIVGGRVWGAVAVVAGHEHPPLPADTLGRWPPSPNSWPPRSPTATPGPRSSGWRRNRRRCGAWPPWSPGARTPGRSSPPSPARLPR